MNINDWLEESTIALKNAGIDSARLDCLILLEKVLGINKTILLASLEKDLRAEQTKLLNGHLKQRLQHLPIAYITNTIEFYGLEFFVDERVLIPRPETEQIIDTLLGLKPQPNIIYDIGTGSGILAITAKKHLPAATVYAVDNSEDALSVAKINAKKHQTDISFIVSDLLSNVNFSGDNNLTIVSNLPYVPKDRKLNPAAKHEPAAAIFAGGKDGLELYKKMISQTAAIKSKINMILEMEPWQQNIISNYSEEFGYREKYNQDFCLHLEK